MEWSSPLAAMQPPPIPTPWGRCPRDIPASRPPLFGSNSFNFRDLSMKKSKQDYFGLPKPAARGSSPTASLAADLSSNFHIDQSPQLATPRRSLFTSNAFRGLAEQEGAITPPVQMEGVTTPPIPSSSPFCGNDSMDCSPLPHKPPYFSITEIQVQAPTPERTPNEDMTCQTAEAPTPLAELRKNVPLAERRRPGLLRPSLTRSKCHSTTAIPGRARGLENQLPPFQFGTGTSAPSHSSTPTLDECFTDSPPQERTMFTNNSLMGPPRPRQLFPNPNGLTKLQGSPLANNNVRKSTCPLPRPRKQFRRSNSMFEHPGDVMKQEKKEQASSLQSIMDVDDPHQLRLPYFSPADNSDNLPRISQDTMISVLNGDFNGLYEDIMVVDCRFEYEYDGGHIVGATNHNCKEALTEKLFSGSPFSNVLLIFHCEYSAHRAPLVAQHIRQQDRRRNAAHYPKLTFPEMYILDGGYSSFFKSHRERCYPQEYVGMHSKGNEAVCEREMGKIKQRAKLGRAQTFAFGQQTCQMEDSPTAPSRVGEQRTLLSIDLMAGNIFDSCRMHARRMASY